MIKEKLPLCRNCFYCRLSLCNRLFNNWDAARCYHQSNTIEVKEDPVSGKKTEVKPPYCSKIRNPFYSVDMQNTCGYEGIFFEPKNLKERKIWRVEKRLDRK